MYVIGGADGTSENSKKVEVFDADTNQWSNGSPLQHGNRLARSITVDGKIYLVGGKNSSNQNINQVLCFDPSTDQWLTKASMPTARDGMWLQWYGSRIWAIGGYSGERTNVVESYDPVNDSWQTETSLSTKRNWPVGWVANGKIYAGGGISVSSIEVYDPTTKQWANAGNFPENKYIADAVALDNKVYVVAGSTASGVYSDKVYAADLNASMEGVYDLYRKDGDAPVGTPVVQSEYADGSVTTSKLDATILKYLKPEITTQPQSQTVYADSNVSFSVTAEGKYLTYQWKKDGVDLTGETNATLNITDANATNHDGNYSVVVSNDFGSMESGMVEVLISSFSVISIPNIELWLDSSDSSKFTLNIQKVSIWHDKSGNENNATQTLASKQPEFGQDQNGKFVKFTSSYTNGDADSVLADNYLIVPPISVKSSFFIIDHDGSKVSMLLGSKEDHKSYILIGSDLYALSIDGYNSGSGPSDIGSWWFNGAFQSTGGDLGASGQIPLNTPSLHSVIYQLNDPMFPFYRIGSYRDNKAGFGGKIREIIIFDDYLDESNRQKVEGYLAHKWGLTNSLPTDHPYKNNAP